MSAPVLYHTPAKCPVAVRVWRELGLGLEEVSVNDVDSTNTNQGFIWRPLPLPSWNPCRPPLKNLQVVQYN